MLDIFNKIYENNVWRRECTDSGPGSVLANTKNIREKIPVIIEKFKIKTIFDCPCGDFNWMKEIDLSSVTYLGGDIVKSLIEKNNDLYSSNKVNFVIFDIVEKEPPAVDLMITRDCFIHFPRWAVKKSLSNIKKSRVKYLLTTSTSFSGASTNNEIEFGDWTWLNLQLYPYFLPEPIFKIKEEEENKFACLWSADQIPEFDE